MSFLISDIILQIIDKNPLFIYNYIYINSAKSAFRGVVCMFNICVADTVCAIDNKYDYIEKMCRDYITDSPAAYTISVTDKEIMAEEETNGAFPPDYLETLAIYRKLTDKLAPLSVFLMHGVLMEADGRGILLCAESGTGKTTHSALWLRLLGDRCRIINGDKPLLRIIDGIPYAYGTPWCGKEKININHKVVLSDICFLERSKENFAKELSLSEVVRNLLPSVHLPDGESVTHVLDSVNAMSKKVKFWQIGCNMDISAAETVYNAIMK